MLYPEIGREGKRIRERKSPASPRATPPPSLPVSAPNTPISTPKARDNIQAQDDGMKTPRPKRKRVEPKRIQDSLERPQWLSRTKPSDTVVANGNESRKSTKDEVRSKPPRSSSMKHSGDLSFLKNSQLGLRHEPTSKVPTLALDKFAEQKIVEQDKVKKQPMKVEESTSMYGHKIPGAPPENTCAGCLGVRDKELVDDEVLLCDGQGCGREYHLKCCVPALRNETEQERWLCQDCCPNGGSTAFLMKYLEESDREKAEFLAKCTATDPHEAFIDRLLRQDSIRDNKPTDRFPVSQLERGALIDATARSDTFSRTRRGQEQTQPLTPDFFVGKPIRIFSLVGYQYHTGRIVDYRVTWKSENCTVLNDIEFLIRFPAGTEGRKTSYRHWIVLEEHGACVGTTIVWAGLPDGSWQPSTLWLHTARELVPDQHLLSESEGQIHYRTADATHQDHDTPVKSNFKILGLIRPFGYPHVFHTLNAKDRMMDLFHESALRDFLKDGKSRLQFELAKAEFNELLRVRRWRALKLMNPMGYRALSSADSYSLEPLRPPSYGQSVLESHAALCPTVPRGLDRRKLLDLIQRRRGIEPTKDVGAGLTCRLLDFHPDMLWLDKRRHHINGKNDKNGTGDHNGNAVASVSSDS